jgi:hypothetical protein
MVKLDMAQRKGRTERSAGARRQTSSALKIKMLGADGAPLTMAALREGLLEAARLLKQYEAGYKAKAATLYVPLIDEDGKPVRINDANELTVRAYRSAAEELGL